MTMPNIPFECTCVDDPDAMGFHSYECQELRRWLNAEFNHNQLLWVTAEKEWKVRNGIAV